MKDTIGYLEKRNKELTDKVIEQDVLIKKMRDVLRFCARTNVGSYYQQESAKAMLFFGGGQEELVLNDKEEGSLLQIK